MDIVFNIDNRYIQHTCVTMLSVCSANYFEKINFHVLSCNLSKENKRRMENVMKGKSKIYFYQKDELEIKDFPIGKGTCNERLSSAAYLRLFIPELLPESIHKVLYLDSDIVVCGSLKDLWETSIEDYCVASVDDCWPFVESEARRLGLPIGKRYFNSGVMLLNLDKMREMSFVDKAKQFAIDNVDKVFYHDQDILNYLLAQSRLSLSSQWNQMEDGKDGFQRIIHFAGKYKPWHKECHHSQKFLYYRYLQQTEWQDYQPVYYHSFFERIKRTIKRCAKII